MFPVSTAFLDTLIRTYFDDRGYPLRIPLMIAFALFASVCVGSTLRSKRVIASTSVSLVCYVLALALSTFLRAKGIAWPDPAETTEPRSLTFRIWESTCESAGRSARAAFLTHKSAAIILFAFATPLILPLYAVLERPSTVHSERKKNTQSFTAISCLWLALSMFLLVPLIFVSPGSLRSTVSLFDRLYAALIHRQNPQAAEDLSFSPAVMQNWIVFLRAFGVVAAMPSIMSILPTPNSNAFGFPARSRRLAWRACFLIIITLLALSTQRVARFLLGGAMLLSLTGSYVLPCLLHIVHHFLRRPQAILVPANGSIYTMYSPNGASEDEGESEGLLQRKEHSLQRRRFVRRIVWDVAVWLVILPLGGASLGWAGGRMVGRW